MSGVVSSAAMMAGAVEAGAATARGNGSAQGAMCARCGYRLAGLEEVGCCPECGLSARLSREPDHLSLRAAWYLKRLRVGAALIIAALVMALGAVLAAAAITQSMDGPFAFVFLVCSPSLWLAGWWLMTGRDRDFKMRDGAVFPLVNRVLLVVYIVPLAILLGLGSRAIDSVRLMTALEIMLHVMSLALLAHWFVSLVFVRALAKRVQRKDLGRLAVGVMAATPVMLVLSGLALVEGWGGRYDMVVTGGPVVLLVAIYAAMFVWLRWELPRESRAKGCDGEVV